MQRVEYIDQIAGLLIVYMIVYHALQFCDMWQVVNSHGMQLLAFFMFWFFYKSGMFAREKSCREILIWGGQKLMVPFVAFSVIGHFVECVHKVGIGELGWADMIWSPLKCLLAIGAVGGNLPLWFLPSLLAVQLLYALLHRKLCDDWIGILGFVVAYLTFLMEWHKPLYVGNIALGLFAYSMGHRLKDKQYEFSLFLLSLVTYVTAFAIQSSFIDFRMNDLVSGYYPLAVLFGLSGCILINNLFRKFSLRLKLLEYIGFRSMRYYVMHWIILCVCRWTLSLSGWSLFVAIVGSCIILLPLFDKAFSSFQLEWMFGMKTNHGK